MSCSVTYSSLRKVERVLNIQSLHLVCCSSHTVQHLWSGTVNMSWCCFLRSCFDSNGVIKQIIYFWSPIFTQCFKMKIPIKNLKIWKVHRNHRWLFFVEVYMFMALFPYNGTMTVWDTVFEISLSVYQILLEMTCYEQFYITHLHNMKQKDQKELILQTCWGYEFPGHLQILEQNVSKEVLLPRDLVCL